MAEGQRLGEAGVDPAAVPVRILASGARMPVIGLGTFGSDQVEPASIAAAVRDGARAGYRHFDCAAVYGNEAAVGESLREVMRETARREELWVTSKLWNDKHAPKDVALACRQTLKDLGLESLDLYLVHWPFRNFHPPGCEVTSRSEDAHAYRHEEFMETWGAMERLAEEGLVRHLGTSNVTEAKMELILRDARVRPACNEMELHPHFSAGGVCEVPAGSGDSADRVLSAGVAGAAGAGSDGGGHVADGG